MATRRLTRTSSRKAGARLETRAHANRVFKKVTRQWQLAFNIKCQIVSNVSGSECPNGGKIILMSNAELHGNAPEDQAFPDAVRIRKIDGNLYFRPTQFIVGSGVTIEECFATAAENNRTTYMRMGLKKAQGPQSQAGVPDALNPLNNGATPYHISDYADGRWMKMWEHIWDARTEFAGALTNNFSCCTSQASYAVPPTASGSQAGYTVPAAVCQPCGDVEDPAINLGCVVTAHMPTWWHCRIRYGRTIVMKESDDLSLYFGWEKLMESTAVDRPVQPDMEFFGGVRMLLES